MGVWDRGGERGVCRHDCRSSDIRDRTGYDRSIRLWRPQQGEHVVSTEPLLRIQLQEPPRHLLQQGRPCPAPHQRDPCFPLLAHLQGLSRVQGFELGVQGSGLGGGEFRVQGSGFRREHLRAIRMDGPQQRVARAELEEHAPEGMGFRV